MSYFMVFTLFMMLVLPAMMKNMGIDEIQLFYSEDLLSCLPKTLLSTDPEQMKEMQDQMAQNDPNSLLQDPNALLSSLFGGGGKKDED